MVSARLVLGTLGFLQLASVCFNFWSPLIFYMLPVALLSTVILWISIYYNWKRGNMSSNLFLVGPAHNLHGCDQKTSLWRDLRKFHVPTPGVRQSILWQRLVHSAE